MARATHKGTHPRALLAPLRLSTRDADLSTQRTQLLAGLCVESVVCVV